MDLSRCTMLSKLVANNSTNTFSGLKINFGTIEKVEYIDLTGQSSTGGADGSSSINLGNFGKLHTALLGGTSLQNLTLAEGAPLTTLVLPASLEWLTLRYLPNLTRAGLTLQNAQNVRYFNFASCPNLDWQTLLQELPNVQFIRIENVRGSVRSELLERYMSLGGIHENGIDVDTDHPFITGTVRLRDVVTPQKLAALRAAYSDLTIIECQYSEYIFDDKETDPANISNEDNLTGYDHRQQGVTYTQAKPNGYEASGHVELIHDRCQLCSGLIFPNSTKMTLTRLSKDSLFQTAAGETFNPADPNGEEYDVFMYLPQYFYKGVNDFKNARKHLFLSSGVEYTDEQGNRKRRAPDPTGNTVRHQLQDIVFVDGKAVDNRLCAEGDTLSESVMSTATACKTYRVNVQGMKRVRFPSLNHSYFSHAFTDANNKILQLTNLTVYDAVGNPADFMNEEGDYDFRDIPEDAVYLYFVCFTVVNQQLEVILTDSMEIEAIEPDWVEHKAELIGVYQGYAAGITQGGTPTSGLRSISDKTTSRGNGTSTNKSWPNTNGIPTGLPNAAINGTAQDFVNLARVRGNGYSTVSYETSKDMANLLMAWFGTRDIETLVGRGSSSSYTTGTRNAIAFGDSASLNSNSHNKMWGLECWTGSMYEWMDKCCFNAPSFARFLQDNRPASGWSSDYHVDYYYNIVQQDGMERRIKAATTNQGTNVARVRFGRYCDIVVGSYAGDGNYLTCYACYQSSNAAQGRVVGRSGNSSVAYAGVAYSFTSFASSYSSSSVGGRLCFFGEFENESVLID